MKRLHIVLVTIALYGAGVAPASADSGPGPRTRADLGCADLPSDATAGKGWLVRRGEWAMLAAAQGGVAVESRVEVLQDGRSGQRVLVRGAGSRQPIAARVVGPGAVEPAR